MGPIDRYRIRPRHIRTEDAVCPRCKALMKFKEIKILTAYGDYDLAMYRCSRERCQWHESERIAK